MVANVEASLHRHRTHPRLVVLITSAACLTATLSATPALAASSPALPSSTAPTGTTRTALGDALQSVVDAGVPAAIGAVDDGHHRTKLARGLARLDPARPAGPDDQVRVGSITKTFMATIALQLVADHRLRLDDSVEHWLPGLVPGGRAITVRMLLNHTSGIFNYTDDADFVQVLLSDPYREWTPQQLIAVATAKPPVFAPGQGWSYSNTNYLLVGLILQKITRQPLPDLVARRITGPLHLRDTYFATSPRFRGPYAHGYLPPAVTGDGWLDTSGWTPTWAWAAGAIVSNADDLGTFYRALLSGRLLPAAQLAELTTTVDTGQGIAYGLGIFTVDTPCGTVWGHDGSVPGYLSYALTDRTGRRSTTLFVTTEPDEAGVAAFGALLNTAICAMFGKPVPAGKQPAASALSPMLPFLDHRSAR
jgi:D-alanyl-D-alanine carboxypeptidase